MSTGKFAPVLNSAPHHEDVRETGGIEPLIFKFGIRWWRAFSFTSRLLYPEEKALGVQSIGGWVEPSAVLDVEEEKKSLSVAGNQTLSPVALPTELSRFRYLRANLLQVRSRGFHRRCFAWYGLGSADSRGFTESGESCIILCETRPLCASVLKGIIHDYWQM
jgi:hypothetical protein